MNFRGVNIAYKSAGGNVSPKYSGSAAYPFVRYFAGGMLWTCGPDNIGDGAEGLPFHGSFGFTPAENVNIIKRWEGDRYIVTVSGDMHFKKLFGGHIIIRRTVTTEYNSGHVEVRDTVENAGYKPDEYALLYHYNFGYPFAADGAKIIAPHERIEPRTKIAEDALKDADCLCAPMLNSLEFVYYRKQKEGKATLVSPIGISCTLKYDVKKLPWLIQWKSMAAGDYALGLEPATSRLDQYKKSVTLAPGQSEEYVTSLEFKKNEPLDDCN